MGGLFVSDLSTNNSVTSRIQKGRYLLTVLAVCSVAAVGISVVRSIRREANANGSKKKEKRKVVSEGNTTSSSSPKETGDPTPVTRDGESPATYQQPPPPPFRTSTQIPDGLVKTATITELWVHPVKGMLGMSPESATIGPTGFMYDREWAVMVNGVVVSCNKYVKINSARANIVIVSEEEEEAVSSKGQCSPSGEGKGVLLIEAPDLEPLRVRFGGGYANSASSPSSGCGSLVEIDIFGMKGIVKDEGDEAAEWLQKLLPNANGPRLVRVVKNRRAEDSPSHIGTNTPTDEIKLHDYAAFHIICKKGVEWLQGAMPDPSAITLTTEQFRANIVLDDTVPFPQEDHWDTIRLRGDSTMRVAKQSGRCVIPTTQRGVKPKSFEPTSTLRRLRRCYHRHQLHREKKDPFFMFGLDLFPEEDAVGKVVSVGDSFEVISVRDPPEYF